MPLRRAAATKSRAGHDLVQVVDDYGLDEPVIAEALRDFLDLLLGMLARVPRPWSIENVVREQPLLIALAGIAAGAGVAAVFPVSSMEKEAFEPVNKHVEDAVQYASAEAKDALGRAGDKLKEVVQDKGLTTDGLKRMAGEVISAVGGKAICSAAAAEY